MPQPLDTESIVTPMKNALSAALQEFTAQTEKFDVIDGENLFKTTERFQKWIKALERKFTLNQKTDNEKKFYLLSHLSEKALEDYEAIPEITTEQNSYLNCVETLRILFCAENPHQNAEKDFLSIRPLLNETPLNTLRRISKAAQRCNYDHPEQEAMRLALAVMTNEKWLEQITDQHWTKENFAEGMAYAKQLEQLRAAQELIIDAKATNGSEEKVKTLHSTSESKQTETWKKCRRCLRNNHEPGKRNCPSYGQICFKCGLLNHFSRSCDVKPPRSKQQHQTAKDEPTVKTQYMGTNPEQPKEKKPCRRCLRHHEPGGKCYAKGQICHRCGIINHYARACHAPKPSWGYSEQWQKPSQTHFLPYYACYTPPPRPFHPPNSSMKHQFYHNSFLATSMPQEFYPNF